MAKRLSEKQRALRDKRKLIKKEKKEAKLKPKRELKAKLNRWKAGVIQRDNCTCQRCRKDLTELNKKGNEYMKHPHHIISFESVINKYPQLLEDLNNGILLCSQCHKFNDDSAHESGFEFTMWLMQNKTLQYNYLKSFLMYHSNS